MANEITVDVTKNERVTQHDIIDELLVEHNEFTRGELTGLYENFVDRMLDHLWNGKNVDLTRLARIELVDRAAHKGRNPYTNEAVDVPRRQIVRVRNRVDLNNISADVNEETNTVTREGSSHPRTVTRRARNERQRVREETRRKMVEVERLIRELESQQRAYGATRPEDDEEYERVRAEAERARAKFDALESEVAENEAAGE